MSRCETRVDRAGGLVFHSGVSKQRPSGQLAKAAKAAMRSASRKKHNWKKRVFRNSYTRGAQQRRVKNWSIKLQHEGVRRTLSLKATTRGAAALEAQSLWDSILTRGWDSIAALPSLKMSGLNFRQSMHLAKTTERYWRGRLIRRPSLDPRQTGKPEFSARIDHPGGSHYFPLGTLDEGSAATAAREIHQTAVRDGWKNVRDSYRRELTVALHWADDPVAWTYTTLQSIPNDLAERPPLPPRNETRALPVLVIESDPGVRRAVAECIDRQEGFICVGQSESGQAAISMLRRAQVRLVLAGRSLADQSAAEFERALRETTGTVALFFGIYEDSDHLFRATPGGASGYFLKRTPPGSLLEPIAGLETLSREKIGSTIRRYFQKVVALLSAQGGKEMARLTAREHEILNLLSRGHLDKEIADALRISVWTVHGHLKKVFEKLGVHTRTEAAIKYLDK